MVKLIKASSSTPDQKDDKQSEEQEFDLDNLVCSKALSKRENEIDKKELVKMDLKS